ncbi:hypothetical protein K461DRAFT_282819 [Myriangium duriaei CBS 260.36]|uniref:Potassium channel tetramerisation-type BTB domain-containing protein n=1 Tax=Myriangium duriaei CBS 260.36 TaxID=1168546 RepID=A0A9P4IQT7_9PEZI|nr:hypothetical protein K461DRAFT_282819 [Myriangium duriaei CBS 260.36]
MSAEFQQSDDFLANTMHPVGELQRDGQESTRQNGKSMDVLMPMPIYGTDRNLVWAHESGPPLDPITRPQCDRKRKRSYGHEPPQPPRLPTMSSGDGDGSDDSMEDDGEDDDDDDLEGTPAPAATDDHGASGEVLDAEEVIISEAIPESTHNDRAAPGSPTSESQQQNQDLLERTIVESDNGPMALPANQVFPIQVGSKLFRLSGASISSDAPSYFTQFFQAQLRRGVDVADIKTLYLDRDPETFRDISLHLQGYHVEPLDSTHFVRLFADAQFFSLPRLIQRLYRSEIFVKVGDEEFKISRDIFDSPGDTPNYFSLGFSAFFSTPENVFPGLDQGTLLRPPSIKPPHIPTKSPAVFRELLNILDGYEVRIRDDEHRQTLLRDARYYHLKGLEQKLVAHQILYNVHRKQREIVLRLGDIKATGISLKISARSPTAEVLTSTNESISSSLASFKADLAYARPFTDSEPLSLIFELGSSDITLQCSFDRPGNTINLCPSSRTRILNLYKIIRTKVLETGSIIAVDMPQSPPVAVIERDAHVRLDGRNIDWTNVERGENDLSKLWIASLPEPPEEEEAEARQQETWVVNRSQWRLTVSFIREPKPVVTVTWRAVKIDAVSGEAQWNAQREFL